MTLKNDLSPAKVFPMQDLKRIVFDSKVKNKSAVLLKGKPIPENVIVRILRFGVCCPYAPDGSVMALQFGDDERHNTLRVACGSQEFSIGWDLVGDGKSFFKILAKNEGSHHKHMIAWAEYTEGAPNAQ